MANGSTESIGHGLLPMARRHAAVDRSGGLSSPGPEPWPLRRERDGDGTKSLGPWRGDCRIISLLKLVSVVTRTLSRNSSISHGSNTVRGLPSASNNAGLFPPTAAAETNRGCRGRSPLLQRKKEYPFQSAANCDVSRLKVPQDTTALFEKTLPKAQRKIPSHPGSLSSLAFRALPSFNRLSVTLARRHNLRARNPSLI
ncbi:hypothetical protein PDE_01296 [Penicillium oxalicum 114-2]|uniref:Uncharacterized protein n=1 Tax=Penicillium oxalicum (strain 114-2 / CGMCC 5302) TaxID=933388 RepID=S7Z752_PENO1|nr:hypothetical protein PDE_01296 [Penicillium oxalicum 114-2]